MGAGEVSIQRQPMFTFGDALGSALGQNVDKPQPRVAKRVVGNGRQGYGQLGLCRSEGCDGIGDKGQRGLYQVHESRSDKRLDIAGVG